MINDKLNLFSVKREKSSDLLRQITKSTDFNEQRKTARLDIPLRINYKVVGKQKNTVQSVAKNVSIGGCLFLAEEKIPLNTEVELQFFLNDNNDLLNLKGRVIRIGCKKNKLYEFGISFNPLTNRERERFADYFFAKMYEMTGLSEWPTNRA